MRAKIEPASRAEPAVGADQQRNAAEVPARPIRGGKPAAGEYGRAAAAGTQAGTGRARFIALRTSSVSTILITISGSM